MLPRLNGSRMGGARNITMIYLAQALPSWSNLGRPIIDQTGVNGTFDFTMEWKADTSGPLVPEADAATRRTAPVLYQLYGNNSN
jgi:uncharacterized protein (TIGR03435 family)